MMQAQIEEVTQLLQQYLPNLIAALAVLILGWLAALAVAAIIRGALRKTNLGTRLTQWMPGMEKVRGGDVEQWVGRCTFYVLLLFVLVAFFQVLGLTLVTEPLNRLLSEIFVFLPRLFGALALLLVAWIVGGGLRFILFKLFDAINLDERLGQRVSAGGRPASTAKMLSDAVYWLVFLLFLPAILTALALEGLLSPVQAMVNKILATLPNIFSAAVILIIGWFLARIIQQITTNLLATVGTDRLSERVGLASVLGTQQLSGVIGLLVYVLILFPVLIAALNALGLEAITQPASSMLTTLLAALPAILAAALVLIVAYVIGRIVAGLLSSLLSAAGFNTLMERLGLGIRASQGQRSPAEVTGTLVLVVIMLLASIEAAEHLGFSLLADLMARFTVFAGQVILGLVILGIGLYLSDLAARTLRASSMVQAGLLATAVRIAIIILAGAMALRQMGIADEIVNLAFGLLFGALAVAVAIAFGLGGRDIASRELSQWVDSVKSKKQS